ncbi:hypothetical protein Bca52824_037566 [Brassica carinata]|uniref:Uncharacterized protein n=1 Tax=Brassica carinata TaxID=52824 RepID=A0A8X7UU32_BRACI|nr:hypothetical protein Bca52824_037566 [Brassica carinata]
MEKTEQCDRRRRRQRRRRKMAVANLELLSLSLGNKEDRGKGRPRWQIPSFSPLRLRLCSPTLPLRFASAHLAGYDGEDNTLG